MRPVMLVCLQDHPRAGPFSHRIIVNPDDAAVVTYSDAQQAQPPHSADTPRLSGTPCRGLFLGYCPSPRRPTSHLW
jgi:hypothetical protein